MSHKPLGNSYTSLPGTHSLKTKLYKRRYLVVISFAFNDVVNAILWISFASVQSRAVDSFRVSSNWINLLSTIFMILYIPGSISQYLLINNYGLRVSFIMSSLFQTIGQFLRYLATLNFIYNAKQYWLSYFFILFGSIFPALFQPFYVNSPARLSAEWFSLDGRDIATALLSIVNVLGIGLGTVIPTIFVGTTPEDDQFGGFKGLMLFELILCIVGLLLTLLFHYDKPPQPPSVSQIIKQQSIESGIKMTFYQEFITLITNTQFIKLFIGFGIGLGLFNGLTTLINQYTSCFGYTTDDAGAFGGALIGGGLIGAVVAGAVMELTRKYNSILKSMVLLTLITTGIFLWQLKADNFVIVTIILGIFGFCAIPIVAVTFECAAETTFPVSEELGSALLMTSGSILGVIYVSIWGANIPETCDSQLNFSTYFMSINLIIMVIVVLLYNGDYKRLNTETNTTVNDDDSVWNVLNDEISNANNSSFNNSSFGPKNSPNISISDKIQVTQNDI